MEERSERPPRSMEAFGAWLRWSRTDEILALLELIKTELGRRGQGVLKAVPKTSTAPATPPTAKPEPVAQGGLQHPAREVPHEEAQTFFRKPNNPD